MDIAPTHNHESSMQLLPRLAGNEADVSRVAGVPERLGHHESRAIATVLRLLSDTTRLRLLFLLVRGERSVTDLYTALGIAQPTVSHHLAWLRASSLVVFRRHGKRVYYALGPAVLPEGDWLTIGALRIRVGGDA